MDGSAAPFVYLVQEAGVKRLAAPRKLSEDPAPDRAVARRQAHRVVSVGPISRSPTASVSITRCCGTSRATMRISEESFIEDIAPARTFGFLKEVEMLRQRGLALGGSLDNAIVLGDTGVLNNALQVRGRVRSPQDSRRARGPGARWIPDRRPRGRSPRRARAPHRVRGEDPV